MPIRLSARMIGLALALLVVALLLVGIAALHAAQSVPWHTLVSSPDVFGHDH